MMIDNNLLARRLRALAKQPGTYRESSLPQPNPGPLQLGAVGVGTNASLKSADSAAAVTLVEQCVIWSEVLVQEAGVFELPPGWPDDNTYPGSSFPDADLPVDGDAYVTQRRVHAYVYMDEASQEKQVRKLMTSYALPFASDFTEITFPAAGGLFDFAVKSAVSSSATVDDVIANLLAEYGA